MEPEGYRVDTDSGKPDRGYGYGNDVYDECL